MPSVIQYRFGVQTAVVAKKHSVSIYLAAAGSSYSGVLMSSELLNSKSIICRSSDIKTNCNAVDSEAKT